MRNRPAASGVVLACVAGILLLVVPVPRNLRAGSGGELPGPLAALPPATTVTLEVNPPTWQMTGGNSTALVATWLGSPPSCSVTPRWYHWTLPASPIAGELNATAGPAVTFVGNGAAPGATDVAVEGVADLECVAGSAPIVENATATVTVVPNLDLANISVAPAPLTPGQSANLSASISGGEPPYSVEIDWGDGGTSATGLTAPGQLLAPHVFLDAGEYTPSLTVTDAGGHLAHAVDPSTVEVTDDTAISISATPGVTDIGLPVAWNLTVARDPTWFNTNPTCNGIPPSPPILPDATSGTCAFSVPGRAVISADLEPVFGESGADASTTIEVEPSPTVAVAPSEDPTELGVPTELIADIQGGVPPLILTCDGPDLATAPRAELLGDGTVSIPLDPSEVGRMDYTVQVEDAEGVSSPAVLATILVEPDLNVSFEEARVLNSTGANLSVTGSVTDGVGPFAWSIIPSVSGSGATDASGELAGSGTIAWSASYRATGVVDVEAFVADAAGNLVRAEWDLPAIPALTVSVDPADNGTGGSGSVDLSVGIAGGLPPFNVSAQTAGATIASVSAGGDGSFTWRLGTTDSGPVAISVVVHDSAGDSAWANTSIDLPVPAPSPSTNPGASLDWGAAGLGVLAATVVLALVWTRRRRPTTPVASVDPTSVLRSILAPADGAERTSVELLAEEEGVPLEEARRTLDQLIAAGTVRSETDPDGVEVLSWDRGGTT